MREEGRGLEVDVMKMCARQLQGRAEEVVGDGGDSRGLVSIGK